MLKFEVTACRRENESCFRCVAFRLSFRGGVSTFTFMCRFPSHVRWVLSFECYVFLIVFAVER